MLLKYALEETGTFFRMLISPKIKWIGLLFFDISIGDPSPIRVYDSLKAGWHRTNQNVNERLCA
jgi:hypothetical protein